MRTWIKIDPTGKTKEQLFEEIAKVNPLSAGKRDRDYSTVENVRWWFRGDSKEQILDAIYFYNAYGDIANWEVGWFVPERKIVLEALEKKGKEMQKKYGIEQYSVHDDSAARQRKQLANKRAEENKAKMDNEWITYTHRYPGGYIPTSKINEALKEHDRISEKYLGSLMSSVGQSIKGGKMNKPSQTISLDDLIRREQPNTLSKLWELVATTRFMLNEIRIVRYYGAVQGVKIKVRDNLTGETGWLPRGSKVYSIFK
ncbi:MAG: hypothetical protein PHX21_12970 [bacterium]|nr:hypothetical protein [bacterium]